MHLLGRSIKVELNPGTAERADPARHAGRTTSTTRRARPLAKPVDGQAGRHAAGHLHPRRHAAPQLPAAAASCPPRYVVWGEGTSDEMCLGILAWGPAA